jgi:hypothetical protein
MDNPATEQRRLERAEKDRKAALAERNEEQDLLKIMDNPGGRRFLRWVLKACKYGEDPSDPNSSTVYKNIGRQMVGRELSKEMLKVSQQLYFLLLKEGLEEVKSKHQLKGGSDGE